MRLDKYVANNAGLSRKDTTTAIRLGEVSVDQQICKNGAANIGSEQQVTFRGAALLPPTPIYWMLHKPKGVVCANSDASYPTVFDLIKLEIHPALKGKLQIAGRLDLDTTGLVLITSDGEWNHAITSPNKLLGKRYRVTTAEPIASNAAELFASGVKLHNEPKATRPAKLQLIDSHTALLEIHEGKYHQVKRMFAATGNKVVALHREAIANIELDANLPEGHFRPLTPPEISLN